MCKDIQNSPLLPTFPHFFFIKLHFFVVDGFLCLHFYTFQRFCAQKNAFEQRRIKHNIVLVLISFNLKVKLFDVLVYYFVNMHTAALSVQK